MGECPDLRGLRIEMAGRTPVRKGGSRGSKEFYETNLIDMVLDAFETRLKDRCIY